MSHPKDRGARLHHRERVIKNRVQDRPTWFTHTDPQRLARAHGRLASTNVPCSCFMCGNPRRHFFQCTLAEKKAALGERDWLRGGSIDE